MEYVELIPELRRLENEGNLAKMSLIIDLLEAFPDLRLFRDGKSLLLVSESANSEVDTLEINSWVHDCDGKPLEIRTYLTVDQLGTRLYSDPPSFTVADQNRNGFGEIPREGWKEQLQEASINWSAISKIKDYLERHPPVDYFDDETTPGD